MLQLSKQKNVPTEGNDAAGKNDVPELRTLPEGQPHTRSITKTSGIMQPPISNKRRATEPAVDASGTTGRLKRSKLAL